MADTGDDGTGRTWPDVASQALRALGFAAPIAIIAGGLLYGGYFYFQQIASARKSADEEVSKAQERLINSYERFQKISNAQLDNIESLMRLRSGADKEARLQTEQVRQLQDQARKLTNDLKDREKQITEAMAEVEEQRVRLLQQQDQLKARENEIAVKERRIDASEKARKANEDQTKLQLQERADRIKSLTDQLNALARSISSGDLGNARRLAADSISATVDVNGLLQNALTAQKNADEQKKSETLQALVGLPLDQIWQKLKMMQNQDPGSFDQAIRYSITATNDKFIVVIVGRDASSYRDLFILSARDGNIYATQFYARFLFAEMPTPEAWYDVDLASIWLGFDGPFFERDKLLKDRPTYAELVNSWSEFALGETIGNADVPIAAIDAAELPTASGQNWKSLVDFYEFVEPIAARSRKAREFSASAVAEAVPVPRGLRQAFDSMAEAVVKRKSLDQLGKAVAETTNRSDLNSLAFAVLSNNVRISSQFDAGENSSVLVLSYEPVGVSQRDSDGVTERSAIRFDRASDSDGWQFVDVRVGREQIELLRNREAMRQSAQTAAQVPQHTQQTSQLPASFLGQQVDIVFAKNGDSTALQAADGLRRLGFLIDLNARGQDSGPAEQEGKVIFYHPEQRKAAEFLAKFAGQLDNRAYEVRQSEGYRNTIFVWLYPPRVETQSK